MKHYLLIYHLAPDYLAHRPQFREAHLALAKAAVARGELLLGGALDPADRAVLLFAGEGAGGGALRRGRSLPKTLSYTPQPVPYPAR